MYILYLTCCTWGLLVLLLINGEGSELRSVMKVKRDHLLWSYYLPSDTFLAMIITLLFIMWVSSDPQLLKKHREDVDWGQVSVSVTFNWVLQGVNNWESKFSSLFHTRTQTHTHKHTFKDTPSHTHTHPLGLMWSSCNQHQ